MGLAMEWREEGLEEVLNVAQGSLLGNERYMQAVEAAVVAAGRGAGKGRFGKDWSDAMKRLLSVRRNPPLSLWWAFLCVECGLFDITGGLEEASALVSSACHLLRTLKSFAIGSADSHTAVSVLSPVLSAIFEVTQVMSRSVGKLGWKGLSESEEGVGKKRRKIARSVRDLIREVLGFVVLCQRWDLDAVFAGPPPAPKFRRDFASLLASKNVKGVVPHPSSFVKFPLCSRARAALSAGEELSPSALCEILCAEVILLQLLLEIIDWRSRLKKQKKKFEPGSDGIAGKLKHMAVHSVATAACPDALLDILLDPQLPVGDVLDSQEEAVLRGVLYEVVFVMKPALGRASMQELGGSGFQAVNSCMKKLAVGRLASAFLRSTEERSRAAALQSKMMSMTVPPQFFHWLQTVEIGLDSFAGSLQDEKAVLGWLIRSIDDNAFKVLFESCKLLEKESSRCEIPSTAEGGDDDLFFVDTRGETDGGRTQEGSALESADRAFAFAAKEMRENSDLAGQKRDTLEVQHSNAKPTPIDESASESGASEGHESGMEDDHVKKQPNGSGVKRPRGASFPSTIELSSGEDSDGGEVMEGHAKRLKEETAEEVGVKSSIIANECVGNSDNSAEKSKVGSNLHTDSQSDISKEAILISDGEEEDGTAAVLSQDDVVGIRLPAAVKDRSVEEEEDEVAEKALSRCTNPSKGTKSPISAASPRRQNGGRELADSCTTLTKQGLFAKGVKPLEHSQSSQGEVVIPPAAGPQDEGQVYKRGFLKKGKNPSPDSPEGHVEGQDSLQATKGEAHQSPFSKPVKGEENEGETEQQAEGNGHVGTQTPEVTKTNVFSTPVNTGSRIRKRQSETTGGLLDQLGPRVTRSGRVLGVTRSVERNAKKGKRAMQLTLEPLFDSNAE